eukprot:Clim_evm118s149 gene=Clim_evmTU118s149
MAGTTLDLASLLLSAENLIESHGKAQENTIQLLESLIEEFEDYAQNQPDEKVEQDFAVLKNKTTLCRSKVATQHKNLAKSIASVQKTVDKSFLDDVGRASNPQAFKGKNEALNSVMAQHLYRQGMFDIGETLAQEANVFVAEREKSSVIEMYSILESMKSRELRLAMEWCTNNREKLLAIGSNLEFKIHRLHFLECIKAGKVEEARLYAKANFPAWVQTEMAEIRRLMTTFAFVRRLDTFPYREILEEDQWSDICYQFLRDACKLLGVSHESPLYVCVTSGCQALPTLLKMAAVLSSTGQGKAVWSQTDELPVPIDLGKNRQYHSVFACPVSREHATHENPPMMLPCGHAICKQSLKRVSKGPTRIFKCPYCPSEQTPGAAKELHL